VLPEGELVSLLPHACLHTLVSVLSRIKEREKAAVPTQAVGTKCEDVKERASEILKVMREEVLM